MEETSNGHRDREIESGAHFSKGEQLVCKGCRSEDPTYLFILEKLVRQVVHESLWYPFPQLRKAKERVTIWRALAKPYYYFFSLRIHEIYHANLMRLLFWISLVHTDGIDPESQRFVRRPK
jgi:hypothetical protein